MKVINPWQNNNKNPQATYPLGDFFFEGKRGFGILTSLNRVIPNTKV